MQLRPGIQYPPILFQVPKLIFMRSISTRIILLCTAFLVFLLHDVSAQVTITPGSTVSQNFNSIGSAAVATLPDGWKADKIATANTLGSYTAAGTLTERAGDANLSSSAANGIYNFGSSTDASDRAIGGLSSSTATKSANVYADLLNSGGGIPSFTISYNVEKYRSGSNAAGFHIQLYYSLDGTNWVSAGNNFLTSFPADAANTGFSPAPGAMSSVAAQTLPVAVPAGGHLYLAWNYSVNSGSTTSNAQALSVDDIVITATSSNDATLSALTMSAGAVTPSFSSTITSYTATVPNSTSAVTITPVTTDAMAAVTVNGNTVASNTASAPVNLAVGNNTITIAVTAQNGTSTQTYTIDITRSAPATPVLTLTSQPAAFGNVCTQHMVSGSLVFDGTDLDGTPVTIAAADGYFFAENAMGPFSSALSVSYTGTSFTGKMIYVQFVPSAVQSYDGNLQITGGGTSLSVPVSGTGINTPATVSTLGSSTAASGATLSGQVTAMGCSAVTGYGFEYSTTAGFAPGTGIQAAATNISSGNFSTVISGLNANNTYYFRAYATNSGGTVYGTQSSFTMPAIPVVMSNLSLLTYSEDFSTISSWGNGFTGSANASHFAAVPVNSNGTIPDGVRITTNNVFASGTSGGVQRGNGNIVLLSTGSSDNSSSAAFDLLLDFTGVNAGTLSFDWASINNSTGDRNGSLRIYASTDGNTFTELPGAAVPDFTNNTPTSGSVTEVALPASFHNQPNARLRFYYYNGTGGSSGSRPKISIDNLVVTALSNTPCATPAAPATQLVFGTATENSIPGSFTAASPAANEYLVVMSSNSSLTSNPVDGQVYHAGDNLGDGTVIARGPSLNFTATGLDDGNTYYFFVFPVNSVCTGGPKYNITDVLTGSAATPAGLPPCAAPASQPSALGFSSAGTTSLQGSFTAAAGADEYLVVRTTDASLSATPANGQVYNVNDAMGNSIVVYRGTASSFTAAGLAPNTTYHFFVFSIGSQSCVSGPAYNTASPLSGSQATQPLPVCSTPVSQPSNLALTASNNTVAGTFNAGMNGDAYLVVISTANTLSAMPADNTDYAAGASLGGGIVVTTTTATSFSASGLAASTPYHVFVFAAAKTCTGGTKYLAADPLTDSVTTTNAPVNNYYFGNLHSHSDYSDGNQDHPGYTPSQDYQYALGSQGMDFLGISEHNHYSSENNPGTFLAKFHSGIQEAKDFTQAHPGFLALYGMEWGVISGGGHVVVYGDNIDKLFGWESNVGGTTGPNYDVFVPKNTYTGSTGLFKTINDFAANNAFATLAHPNNTDYNNLSNIAYDQVADDAIVGSAVANGPSTSTNTSYSNPASSMSYLWYFQKLLAKGYHLGPVIDHDNHNTTFGRTTYARTGVIAPALTQTEIIKAVREMHFYATEDVDAKVDFTINTRMMGSVFTDRNAPSLSVTLNDATTNTSNAVIRVMYGVPGSGITAVKIDSVIGNTLNFVHNDLPNNGTGYYYIDITNEGKRIITSPIWYMRTCAIATDTTAVVCGSFDWYGTTYTTSGTASRTFTTAGGCDSTITLHLTVNHPSSGDTTAAACGSFTWFGNTYTASGDFTHVVSSTSGCDSTITLHLTIHPAAGNVTVTTTGGTSACPGSGVVLNAATDNTASYQWIKDGNDINGASGNTYTATASGWYSVRTSDENNCTAASAPVKISVKDTIAPVPDVMQLPVITAACSATIATAPTASDHCAGTITGATHDPLTYQAQGTYTVHWIYDDGNGNITTQNQTVVVADQVPPSITTQTIIVNTDPGMGGAFVNIGTPVTSDNCGVDSLFSTAPEDGYFPVGVSVVIWTVKDVNGNYNTGMQVVAVMDNEKPVFTTPAGITAAADAGTCGAALTLPEPAVTDNYGLASLTSDAPAVFPVGTTIVTWTASDYYGNAATTTQAVTVTDNEKPVITAPASITVAADNNCTVGTVNLGNPVTSDNCGITSITNNAPASYPFGTTLVTWTATDIHGNIRTAQQTVTVIDNTAPVITAPAPVVACNNGNGNYQSVTAVVTDNCGIQSISYTITGATSRSGNGANASGNFQQGVSTIKWTVKDIHGNTATGSTTVTISSAPAVTVNAASDPFCNGVTVTASASPAGNYSYQWIYNNQPFSTNASIALGNAHENGGYTVKATNTGGCTATATYQYDKTTVAANYTIIATKAINLGQTNNVQSGSVGVTAYSGTLEIKKNSSVASPGAFVKARQIYLQNPVNIPNRIYAQASVAMPAMQVYTGNYNGLPDYTSAVNAHITLTGNYNKLTIRRGTTATLKGSTFRTITIEEGANVSFTNTVLNIESLLVGSGTNNGSTTVHFADNTSARVYKQVKIEEDCIINPEAGRLIFYIGEGKCNEEKFRVTGSNTRITANVYLPSDKIKVDGNGSTPVWMTGHFISEETESGNNVIWNSGACGSTQNTVATSVETGWSAAKTETLQGVSSLQVLLRPNPAKGSFTIQAVSGKDIPVTLRILDQQGRVLETKTKVAPNSTVTMGASLFAGTYFIEGIQGTDRSVTKGIKLN